MPEEFTGSGLMNLRQRAEQVGGEFRIESTPATGGTLLRWSAPLLQ
jgi:two-component system sensor histidine kinase DevS